MKLLHLFLLLFLIAESIMAQVHVTFQVDLQDLIEKKLFSPDEGDRLIVRGSFNNWQGDAYALKQQNEKGLYLGDFNLPGKTGDTIAYKFLILKNPDLVFWEHDPDPGNPDHGNRIFIIDEEDNSIPPARFSYNEYFHYPVVFKREKLQEDFFQFRRILEDTHPAIYDYTPKKVLDSLFDANYAGINGNLEFREFLMLMTDVISKIGCGHSSLWIPRAYWNVAPHELFPLKIYLHGQRAYVTGNYHDNDVIPPGSEILSINGDPVSLIMDKLENLTSADGFNQSYRETKAAQHFSVKYAMAYGYRESFTIEYITPGNREPGKIHVPPVSKATIDKGNETKGSELSLKHLQNDHTALLTINTFGYYGEVDMFKHFIDSVFQILDEKNIHNLILDLRGNSGGDPFCASYLWAYLQPEPLPYFLDHYGRYDTLANPIPQPEKHYTGQLYTLIDGHGFSTTGHFCSLLKYHHVGKFIGTETGATFTCTGNATYPPLDNTRIMVGTARVRRYTAAVQDMDPGRGIVPDFPVQPTAEDMINRKDVVLEYALQLTKNH